MKKIIMLMIAAAATAEAAVTSEQIAARAQKAISEYVAGYGTNGFYKSKILDWAAITNRCASDAEFKAYVEEVFTEKPSKYFLMPVFGNYFVSSGNAAISYIGTLFPTYADLLTTTRRNEAWWPKKDLATQESAYLEILAVWGGMNMRSNISEHRDMILRECARTVRRKLRSEGKPIAGDRGNALAQARLDAVSAALDAPLFQGLAKALEECGSDIKVPASYPGALTGAEITSVTNAIFYGELGFDIGMQNAIRLSIGLKAYNEFVDQYNSGN